MTHPTWLTDHELCWSRLSNDHHMLMRRGSIFMTVKKYRRKRQWLVTTSNGENVGTFIELRDAKTYCEVTVKLCG